MNFTVILKESFAKYGTALFQYLGWVFSYMWNYFEFMSVPGVYHGINIFDFLFSQLYWADI